MQKRNSLEIIEEIRRSVVDADHNAPVLTAEKIREYITSVIIPELQPKLGNSVMQIQNNSIQELRDTYSLTSNIYVDIHVHKAESALAGQVLKSDTWEGVHMLGEDEFIPGAANFRQLSNTNIYGVGQPTVSALQKVLRRLLYPNAQGEFKTEPGSSPSKHSGQLRRYNSVIWINLREEPVVYVSGDAFSSRDPETLNVNLEHLVGIEGYDLEKMEERMKADVKHVISTSSTGDLFSYVFQNKEMKNELRTVKVHTSTVHTLMDLYSSLQRDHQLSVDYHRIPITDELAPEEKDFDELIAALQNADPENTAVVFNCQMGRGRTSTGMIVGYLILFVHNYKKLNPVVSSEIPPAYQITKHSIEPENCHTFVKKTFSVPTICSLCAELVWLGIVQEADVCSKCGFVAHQKCLGHAKELECPANIPQKQQLPLPKLSTPNDELQWKYKNGEYNVILKLMEVLDDGERRKYEVDMAIDLASRVQNLRTAIFDCKEKAEAGGVDAQKFRNRGLNYLERYWWLIVFCSYLAEQAPLGYKKTFTTWMKGRWGLRRLLRRMDLS